MRLVMFSWLPDDHRCPFRPKGNREEAVRDSRFRFRSGLTAIPQLQGCQLPVDDALGVAFAVFGLAVIRELDYEPGKVEQPRGGATK
jgi:hypothetical protein